MPRLTKRSTYLNTLRTAGGAGPAMPLAVYTISSVTVLRVLYKYVCMCEQTGRNFDYGLYRTNVGIVEALAVGKSSTAEGTTLRQRRLVASRDKGKRFTRLSGTYFALEMSIGADRGVDGGLVHEASRWQFFIGCHRPTARGGGVYD